jgi:hypothetical protein
MKAREEVEILDVPDIREMPTEEAVAFLMQTFGEDEYDARLMVAIAKGERSGDTIEEDDPSAADGTVPPSTGRP